MSLLERFAVRLGSHFVSQAVAYRLARAAFATQGIGWAGPAGGMQESGEAYFLKVRLAGLENPVVFDVGANVGAYASAVLTANSRAVLHCFEPSRSHFERLQKTFSGRGVTLNNVGLSDTAATLTLHKNEDISGLASLNNRNLSHLDIAMDIKESVRVVVGDEYVLHHRIDRIDLLKIDVEGWEMSVLRGLKESLRLKLVRCCQFEFGHAHIERRENFRDFWNFFEEEGFHIGLLSPNGRINAISRYDEIYENYYATNYVAVLKSTRL